MIKNNLKILLAGLFYSLVGLTADVMDIPYQDTEFACISQAEAQRFISDFNIDVNSFGGLELCNSQVDTKKLLNDIEILEKGLFTVDTGNKFVRGFVPYNNYYQWLKNETRGIERGQDVPYATAYNRGGYFTMQDGWAKLSTLGRVGTFVHEARHTAGYYHTQCRQGPYQGTSVSGCDTNYNYGGSHAVEMEYYARVSVQGQNFHPVYKKMARLMAIARSNAFFNTPIIQAREAVLGLTQDRTSIKFYENNQWVTREVPQTQGRLKRTSFGGVLFDGMRAFAIELYENSGFPDLISDTYSYYKLLAENKSAVKDFEEFDQGTKRYVVKVSNDNKLTPYDFPNGKWGRDLAIPFQVERTSTAAVGLNQQGFYVINAKGEVYAYQPQSHKLALTTSQWNFDDKNVIFYNNQNLLLKNDGKIYSSKQGVETPWEATNELFAEIITTPIYDGFEVTKE